MLVESRVTIHGEYKGKHKVLILASGFLERARCSHYGNVHVAVNSGRCAVP